MRYNASRLAALLGRFGRNQQKEAILEIWQKVDPEGLMLAMDRNCQFSVAIPSQVQTILSQPARSPAEIEEKKLAVDAAIAALPAALPAAEPLRQHCEKKINTDFGIAKETPIVAEFERASGWSVSSDSTLYTKTFFNPNTNREFKIQGKIDGRLADGRILEIKNRIRSLFYIVRDYEAIQVQTYLELIECPGAVLCEALLKQLHWIEIERDPEFFSKHVLGPLIKMDTELDRLFQDQDAQDRFFKI